VTHLGPTTVLPTLTIASVEDPWQEDLHAQAPGTVYGPRDKRLHRLAWLAPAVVMAVLGLVGVTVPALWTDELATWGMATTTRSEAWSLLRWVDVVIAPYYFFMQGWVDLFGDSDLSLRLPSVGAMTAAAGLIGALGTRLGTPRTGLVAGVLFALLPYSTRFAQEARPYALAVLAGVVATYALVRALERPGFWRWCAYAAVLAVLGLLHGVALLLLGAHGWFVIALRRWATWQWLAAAVVAAGPGIVLIGLGRQQRNQISWIPSAELSSVTDYPRLLFGATVVGLLLIFLSLFGLPLRYPAAAYTAWAIVPPCALIAAAQVTPLWLPRYLLFTLPAWVLLAATALGRTRVVWAVVVVALVALVGIPAQLAVRAPAGHNEATRDLAKIIEAGLQPADGVVYGLDDGGDWVGRDTIGHYLPPDKRPRDLLAERPQRTDGQLSAVECLDVIACLRNAPRLWVVRLGRWDDPLLAIGDPKEEVLRARYRVQAIWHPPGLTLALLVYPPRST
jgi:mannosyltransferase